MERKLDQQPRTESMTQLIAQVHTCLHSGDYSRALDLLRRPAAEFANDPELSELEKSARDGVKRNGEAQCLITESQELFAQRKSAEAIQLLRKAYELDRTNSLARTILANALVEHAGSIVETDWLGAETLTNQALALNPAHPTAKTILSLIVDKKKTSSVEDWVSQARKLQSSGDLFAALAWVAEGLAVHPDDPKLLLIEEAIQRDQEARRHQARRGDLEDMRRLKLEIDGAKDVAAKQAIAERIQALAAKHWTDGEILSIANALLLRLRMAPQQGSTASPQGRGAAVIFHVPRPIAPKPSPADANAVSTSPASQSPVTPSPVAPIPVVPSPVTPENLPIGIVPPSRGPSGKVSFRSSARDEIRATAPETQFTPPPTATPPAAEHFVTAGRVTSPSSSPKRQSRSNSKTLILISTLAAIILFAVTLFFWRKHPAPPVANGGEAAPTVPSSIVPSPVVSAPAATTPEPPPPILSRSSDATEGKVTQAAQPPAEAQGGHPESGQNLGTLRVVAGQDNARVFLNGKLQRQLTQAGELRLSNLEPKDYVVQVSKSGFQDPPQQQIRIRRWEEAQLVFNLQPQPRTSSLAIQGGAPGTTVFVDQTLVGTVQPNGTLSVSTVNPGDHIVDLRKEGFKPRQLKEHFVAGEATSLASTDATLEAAPGELKVTFTPADAKVAIVKDGLSVNVSSGLPLKLVAGSYTLSARTADGSTLTSTVEIVAGQSKTFDLSLPTSAISKWDDPNTWKHERDSSSSSGGTFVLYKVVPVSGTFVFSAAPAKGHLLQWVLNYTDPKNYVLFQMDDDNFYRTVIRNGEKTDEIKIPDKRNKKGSRTLLIRVSPTELVHQIRHDNGWTVLDSWMQPGADLTQGKFGFYILGNDQVALSSFTHLGDPNTR